MSASNSTGVVKGCWNEAMLEYAAKKINEASEMVERS